MNLLTLRMHEGAVVHTIVDDGIMEKILAFDNKRKHHVISNFEFVHPDDRRKYALELLGLTTDPTEAILGENIVVAFRNTIVDLPEKFSQCKKMYVL